MSGGYLFTNDNDERRKLARRSDPATSKQAAAEHVASGAQGGHVAIAAATVARHPGSTRGELAEHIEAFDVHELSRRLSDAERHGLIVKRGARPCSARGRRSSVWYPAGVTP